MKFVEVGLSGNGFRLRQKPLYSVKKCQLKKIMS